MGTEIVEWSGDMEDEDLIDDLLDAEYRVESEEYDEAASDDGPLGYRPGDDFPGSS